MDDSLDQARRDIARAKRIVGGLSDERSRRIVRAYIRELEEQVAAARLTEAVA